MIQKILRDKKIILASQSPRRKEIFKMLGLKALQIPSHIEEKTDFKKPYKIVQDLAEQKAKSVAKNIDYDCVVVASDTIVSINNKILEKPEDKDAAFEMLSELSGKKHFVYSGISIVYKNSIVTSYGKTQVKFKELNEKEIWSYISTGEPKDKAGSYGIQGIGSQFVESINGCYFNVMGFPVNLFYQLLEKLFGE